MADWIKKNILRQKENDESNSANANGGHMHHMNDDQPMQQHGMGDMHGQYGMSGMDGMDHQMQQSHACSMQHHHHQHQQFKQEQVDRQEEAQIELLKDEIDSLFDIFGGVLNYLKSSNVKQSGLLSYNDSVVASLKLFGATCKRKDSDVLNVAHHHFSGKKQTMDAADQRVIKHWLNYAEAGLLGKKLKKLQISKITIDAAHEYMKQGGLQGFLDNYVGAEHDSQDIVQNAEVNREKLRKQNAKTAQQHQQAYKQRQGMVSAPGQHQMYQIAGGADNIEFGSSLYHESSAYYDQRPTDDQENKDESCAMDQDEDESETAPDIQQYAWMNAYVIEPPSQPITRGNKPVNIRYPYPCKIIAGRSWMDGQLLGVVYAKPNDDLRKKIRVSNLERDTVKVSKLEQEYIKFHELSGDDPLGYETIIDQQFQ